MRNTAGNVSRYLQFLILFLTMVFLVLLISRQFGISIWNQLLLEEGHILLSIVLAGIFMGYIEYRWLSQKTFGDLMLFVGYAVSAYMLSSLLIAQLGIRRYSLIWFSVVLLFASGTLSEITFRLWDKMTS